MTTLLAGLCAFLAENWLALVAGAGLVGGWLWICRELCDAAEPEDESAYFHQVRALRAGSVRESRAGQTFVRLSARDAWDSRTGPAR
jgi:hypothetical protein